MIKSTLIAVAVLLTGLSAASAGSVDPQATVAGFAKGVTVSGLSRCLDNYDGMSASFKGSTINWRGPEERTVIRLAQSGKQAKIVAVAMNHAGVQYPRVDVKQWIDGVNTFCYAPVDTRSIGEKLFGPKRWTYYPEGR